MTETIAQLQRLEQLGFGSHHMQVVFVAGGAETQPVRGQVLAAGTTESGVALFLGPWQPAG